MIPIEVHATTLYNALIYDHGFASTYSIPCENGWTKIWGYWIPRKINAAPKTNVNTAALDEKRCQKIPRKITVTIGGVTTLWNAPWAS